MTEERKKLSERSLAGFVLSIMVPVITLALILIIFPMVFGRVSFARELINILYIVIRFTASGAALFFSVRGFNIARKKQISGHKPEVAGIVISCLQLLICALLLVGGLFYGLSIPIESPPETTPAADVTTTRVNRVVSTYTPATYEKNITGNDVFGNGWYCESLDIHTIVKVSNLDPSKGVTWSVFFSEESLSEDEIEKLREREPDIINRGEINASRYEWIYVYCDINSTNSPAPTTDMLNISYQTQ